MNSSTNRTSLRRNSSRPAFVETSIPAKNSSKRRGATSRNTAIESRKTASAPVSPSTRLRSAAALVWSSKESENRTIRSALRSIALFRASNPCAVMRPFASTMEMPRSSAYRLRTASEVPESRSCLSSSSTFLNPLANPDVSARALRIALLETARDAASSWPGVVANPWRSWDNRSSACVLLRKISLLRAASGLFSTASIIPMSPPAAPMAAPIFPATLPPDFVRDTNCTVASTRSSVAVRDRRACSPMPPIASTVESIPRPARTRDRMPSPRLLVSLAALSKPSVSPSTGTRSASAACLSSRIFFRFTSSLSADRRIASASALNTRERFPVTTANDFCAAICASFPPNILANTSAFSAPRRSLMACCNDRPKSLVSKSTGIGGSFLAASRATDEGISRVWMTPPSEMISRSRASGGTVRSVMFAIAGTSSSGIFPRPLNCRRANSTTTGSIAFSVSSC